MSFILDALRKSESERRRDTVPDITRIPLAPARLGLPRWVVPVTTVLGIAVIGLSAAWWYNARPVPTEPPARSEPAARRAAPGLADGLTQSAAASSAAARAGESEPPRARTREVVPLGEVAAGPARATPDEAATRQPAASAADETGAETEIAAALPRLAELRAEGLALPELKLELHVYSETPANRFVFIDGSRYGEGDTLDSGQEVVRVTPDGAVLSHSGRRFLLLPD